MLTHLLSPLGSGDSMAILALLTLATVGTVIAVAAIVTHAVKSVVATRLEFRLTHEMLERGMSAEAISDVINAQSRRKNVLDLPCASEVVAEWGGDWYPALVLQIANGEYYIHYIGNDKDQNEWVGADRVRFPAGSKLSELVAEFSRNGAPVKEPMEAEL